MGATPFLIVGLGNPGGQYEETRHNVGFQVVDALARQWGASRFQKKFSGLLGECQAEGGAKVLLLKPQTYMNLSGDSVQPTVAFYKIDPVTSVLVVSDDLDLPTGRLRLRKSGGSGGHNGLKSIIQSLGTEGFARLRVGIGRPETTGPQVKDHVLAAPSKAERELIQRAVDRAAQAAAAVVKDGVEKAMNVFNQREDTDGA